MTTHPKVTRRATSDSIIQMANTVGASVGLGPCADVRALLAQIKGQISEYEAGLSRLLSAQRAVQSLTPRQQSDRWSPQPGTVYGRVFGLFGEGVRLTRIEIAATLAAEGDDVSIGSISGALTTLGKNGWLVRDEDGWRWPDVIGS